MNEVSAKPEIKQLAPWEWQQGRARKRCRERIPLTCGRCHSKLCAGSPGSPEKVQSPGCGAVRGFLEVCSRWYFPETAAAVAPLALL